MTESTDIDDLLGDEAPAPKKPKAKAAAKKVSAKKAPAKKVAAKAKPAPKKEAVTRAPREPVVFDDGEREDLMKRVKRNLKKPINTRELAGKLDVSTRKLRQVLYMLSRRNEVTLELGGSKVEGMTVSAA